MLRETWNIKANIREEMKKGLVFGLKARLPIGVILAFYGYRHEVMVLMQVISNQTRAYIWNEDGLKGFIESLKIMTILRLAEE